MEIDPTKRINPIARIVVVKNGYILLTSATNKNERFSSDLHFLPGGHVEYTESARDTIIRELNEEIENSHDIKVNGFLGILECIWDNKGTHYHEINIVFRGEVETIDINNPPKSKEGHILYNWYKIDELEKLHILPKKLMHLIPQWLKLYNDNNDNLLQTDIYNK